MSPLLEATGLTVRFGGNTALHKFHGQVAAGEIVGLIGPNGAGKSTLLNALTGLVEPNEGMVRLEGRRVDHLPFHERCRRGMGRTFQTPVLSERLTVEEQLVLHQASFAGAWTWRNDRPTAARVYEVCDGLDLEDKLAARSTELTLGELRRVEMARALLTDPVVLFVDEPSSGMTADETLELGASLDRVRSAGVGVVLIEHNIPFVRSLADRLVVLDAGRLIAEGDVSEVLSSTAVREAYLGHATA